MSMDGAHAAPESGRAMPFMKWTLQLSVGISKFDAEHQRLVELVNAVFDADQTGAGKDALGARLDALIAYTQTHFANEERALQKHAFPGHAAHKAEHEALTAQVVAFRDRFLAGDSASLNHELLSFLKHWIKNHIQGTDRRYTRFLTGKDLS